MMNICGKFRLNRSLYSDITSRGKFS